MYQSLHTTVIGPEGKPLEIQIRTDEMHKTSEYGIAAHWKYKSISSLDEEAKAKRLNWLSGILEWQQDLKDPKDFIESLKIDLFSDEVFVFTPKGRVVSLPKGATPVDFAYSIHTDVGSTCIGAKANARIVPLDYELNHGDIVEIMTSKSSHPSRDWLKIAKTARARSKIRQWFSKHTREENAHYGKETLQKAVKKSKIILTAAQLNEKLAKIAPFYNFKTVDDLYAGVGNGAVSAAQIITKLLGIVPNQPSEQYGLTESGERPAKSRKVTNIDIHGLSDMLVRISKCCNPMPGDEIVGFITRGRGVSIHRKDCINVPSLSKNPERNIEVAWSSDQSGTFPVEIEVMAADRKRLLADITQVLSDLHLNIYKAKVNILKDNTAVIRLGFDVANLSFLENVLSIVRRINSVVDAFRIIPGQAKTIKKAK
jgi:GTP pyrophosphokinase